MISSAVPMLDPAGGFLGFRGVSRDITSSRQAEQERLRLAEELQQAQKMEAVGRLAGGVAHDFNNLLTVINGYSNLLEEQFKPGDLEHEWSVQIARAGERAAGLVQRLLAFSRKQVLEPRVLAVNYLLGNLEQLLVRIVGEDIELTTRLGPSAGCIRVDPHQLEQVILNLAANARDAMPDGGSLTIETDRVEAGEICPDCGARTPSGACVLLTVSDTGAGMDEETRRRVFEPFFTTKGEGKGTGLGLSIVHGIITQSGGHIDVESASGRGTTVRILLPQADPESALRQADEVAENSGGTGTILLVEDQPEVRRFAAAVLGSAGYRILEAGGGEEAIALARDEQGPIHLLLTDVVMPRMSGRELARQLAGQRPETKVLFMSGYSDQAAASQDAAEATVEFIQKPFLGSRLLSEVSRMLARPGDRTATVAGSDLRPAGGPASDPPSFSRNECARGGKGARPDS